MEDENGLPLLALSFLRHEYHSYIMIIKWIEQTLDGGDLILLYEVMGKDYILEGYIEEIIFLACWRII